LHPKIYKPKFFFDVNSLPNYTKKLVLPGIDTTTLVKKHQLIQNYSNLTQVMINNSLITYKGKHHSIPPGKSPTARAAAAQAGRLFQDNKNEIGEWQVSA
jgi:hypothetical protein